MKQQLQRTTNVISSQPKCSIYAKVKLFLKAKPESNLAMNTLCMCIVSKEKIPTCKYVAKYNSIIKDNGIHLLPIQPKPFIDAPFYTSSFLIFIQNFTVSGSQV